MIKREMQEANPTRFTIHISCARVRAGNRARFFSLQHGTIMSPEAARVREQIRVADLYLAPILCATAPGARLVVFPSPGSPHVRVRACG